MNKINPKPPCLFTENAQSVYVQHPRNMFKTLNFHKNILKSLAKIEKLSAKAKYLKKLCLTKWERRQIISYDKKQ